MGPRDLFLFWTTKSIVVDTDPVAPVVAPDDVVAAVDVAPTRTAATEAHEPPAITDAISICAPIPRSCTERVGTGVPQSCRLYLRSGLQGHTYIATERLRIPVILCSCRPYPTPTVDIAAFSAAYRTDLRTSYPTCLPIPAGSGGYTVRLPFSGSIDGGSISYGGTACVIPFYISQTARYVSIHLATGGCGVALVYRLVFIGDIRPHKVTRLAGKAVCRRDIIPP